MFFTSCKYGLTAQKAEFLRDSDKIGAWFPMGLHPPLDSELQARL